MYSKGISPDANINGSWLFTNLVLYVALRFLKMSVYAFILNPPLGKSPDTITLHPLSDIDMSREAYLVLEDSGSIFVSTSCSPICKTAFFISR